MVATRLRAPEGVVGMKEDVEEHTAAEVGEGQWSAQRSTLLRWLSVRWRTFGATGEEAASLVVVNVVN
ncbi:hypothetical protein E2562_037204 [Oryza meyeriana var. granulata]|uniref:Uncharacterized protein n=1 Tax=Oryza meyeriana var. granulata TaxID=110450 RepID=A0A6G1CBD7_9ORYZ|nr:hypothetical protein E2562_037204 [Oryza meyeriana var. granulata]